MFYGLKVLTQAGMFVLGLSACSCFAAGNPLNKNTGEEANEQSWARAQRTNVKHEAQTIIQQKAQTQAEQRQARLASLNWYGISNSRPSTSTTPFTSRYGSMWEMPGGRPYSWYPPYTYTRPHYALYWR